MDNGRGVWWILVIFGCIGCTSATSAVEPPEPDEREVEERCPTPGPAVQAGGKRGTGVDVRASATRRLVLMGGGREDDQASRLFAEAAGGGDVVILRASGSLTSYPDYFTDVLMPDPLPASVTTLRTSTPTAAADEAVLCGLQRAEAIWLAGGNQWNYLGLWPDTVHAMLAAHGGAIGGTSAGAASLGEAAFDARLGTVTSEVALADPFAPKVSVRVSAFAQPELSGMLVDTHFMERSREGRMLVFLARFLEEQRYSSVIGIGLDERVALLIEDGQYRVMAGERGAAWLYEVRAPVALTAGAALNLASVRRMRLDAGQQGAWPPDFDEGNAEAMYVEAGVVRMGRRN